MVENAEVPVKESLKYLGVTVDSRWTFRQHFLATGEKLKKTVAKLSKILPNLGGPSSRVRRLHATVVDSIALYAAPVWTDKVMKDKRIQNDLNQIQRKIACRTIKGYRTISHTATTILAGIPPLFLKGDMYTEIYEEVKEYKAGGRREVPTRAMTYTSFEGTQRKDCSGNGRSG
ncbi:PREDICTED: uncharacterized protein LOC108777848 [Cyphomyrmex costatus]|uniref:uncharacterized protein LOC108777848 n=1 Tax=Cyphomyrmex costatus TaxID=456900 RepID=UPI0008522B81|nr:PREDICTED: uncharacterized protein LOC108777848 [Cyphomyrmex costatus]